jgi:hypothetical protein
MSTNAPSKVIRECDLILEGRLPQTDAQFKRWVVVQIKKLALQASAAHMDRAQIRNLTTRGKR